MIFSENTNPTMEQFKNLMSNTDITLNKEAIGREKYYSTRNGIELEEDVFEVLKRCAINTPFENTIHLISGASFPDIIINNFYGVEVKSTNKNHWKSIGSSILESTRNQNVEKIFLTFGKLSSPVEFRSKPYEECLSGISVTHYPRYQIDMNLKQGETIFDKMSVPYEILRKMKNPIAPVSSYYRSQLKKGESLWWTSSAADDIEKTSVPPTVRLWTVLTPAEKNIYTGKGYALFPEIITEAGTLKYQRYALWLATNCGIVNTNIRDQFSAGGRQDLITSKNIYKNMPASIVRIKKYKDIILDTLYNVDINELLEHWEITENEIVNFNEIYNFLTVKNNRIHWWCNNIINKNSDISIEKNILANILYEIFAI